MKSSGQDKTERADAADLLQRLARLRLRVAGEARPRALIIIDHALEEAGTRESKSG